MESLKDLFGKNTPLEFDITEEFDKLKETFSCKACNKLLVDPIILNTCGHIQCKSCLNNRKLVCMICNCPYNEIDISESIFTKSVTQCIHNMENILSTSEITNENGQEKTFSDGTKFKIIIAKVSMKKNRKGETPLHLACKKGDTVNVEKLIKSGIDVNATDWANWAPIHEAVHKKHYNCVELLLKNNCLVNIPGDSYQTPLHEAIFQNADEITELLLKYGADLNAVNITGCTPMSYITDDEKLNKFKIIDPVNKYVQKVFFSEKFLIFAPNYDSKTISLPIRQGIKFVTMQEYRHKDDTTHLVVSDDKLSLNLLYGILKGIFIVNEKWIEDFPTSAYSFEYVIKTYNDAINRSIENKLQCKPKLFDGIKFHIADHGKRSKIHDLKLTKTDLVNLVDIGGGKVVCRAPTLGTIETEILPYHALGNLRKCSHYIIFNEEKEPELMYSMKELQHRSSKWLIDCILNFKIID